MKEAAEFHSEIAKKFDELYNESPQFIERYEVWSKILERHVNLDAEVLDAGCGSGIFSFFLAKRGNLVSGVDGASEMIKICKKKKEEQGLENVSFKESYIPLSQDVFQKKFDVVISSSVLEYFENVPEIIGNFESFLKSNGTVIFSIPNKSGFYRRLERVIFKLTGRPKYLSFSKSSFTLNEFNEVMRQVGFELKEAEYFSSDRTFDKLFISLLPRKYLTTLFLAVYQKSN